MGLAVHSVCGSSTILCGLKRRKQVSVVCQSTKRDVLFGAAAAGFLLQSSPAAALLGDWDGKSSAAGSCELGDDGAACRLRSLQRDKDLGRTESYDRVSRSLRPQQNSQGIAVADMKGDAYSQETLALGNTIQEYASLDAFDPKKSAVVATIRKDAAAWVSKYARGGSARKVSARRMYIAVDALQGHLAANGLAPLPPSKVNTLLSNVKQAEDLIAQNK